MKSTSLLTVTMAIGLIAAQVSAAALQTGYTPGVGTSQLLTTNGGAGDVLFVDGARTGGENDPVYPPFLPAASALLPGAGFWDVGDTVSITGVALTFKGNTPDGNISFGIRKGAGGDGPTGGGGLAPIGTATASLTNVGTNVYYANFDSPVTFVADASSTTIGISLENDGGSLALKSFNASGGERLQQYNYVNGNAVKFLAYSVAGIVVPAIPEPASVSVAALGLAIVAGRRRR